MAGRAAIPLDQEVRIVMTVLAGNVSVAEVARRNKVSPNSVARWKRQFLEGGRVGLAEGGRTSDSRRERIALAEIEKFKAPLGEAHVELRVWQRSAEYRLTPWKRSR